MALIKTLNQLDYFNLSYITLLIYLVTGTDKLWMTFKELQHFLFLHSHHTFYAG